MPLAASQSLHDSSLWPDEIVQLLDDQHLVVIADPAGGDAADRFAAMLARRLRQMAETQAVVIDGATVRDVPTFCRALEKQMLSREERRRLPAAQAWWRDVPNVISLLRHAPNGAPKRRYFIWTNADQASSPGESSGEDGRGAGGLLQRDPVLFGRLVNALLGVAAEQEHISPDPLVLQRAVFIGGRALERYAEDPHSALNCWLDEAGSPLWEVASVLEKPPVAMYRLEAGARG